MKVFWGTTLEDISLVEEASLSPHLDQLLQSLNDYSTTPEDLAAKADALNGQLVHASGEEQQQTLKVLAEVIEHHPDVQKIGPPAVVCGAIVERGFDSQPLADVVLKRLPEMLQAAAQFYEAWQSEVENQNLPHPSEADSEDDEEELYEKYYGIAGQMMNVMPEAGHNWEGLQTFWPACIALFSKNSEARRQARAFKPLADRIATEHEAGHWLSILLDVLHEEPLLVLEPATRSGFRGTMSGIADNFQLQMFLMELLQPQGFFAKMLSPSFPDALSQLIRGHGPQQLDAPVHGRWNMYAYTAFETGQLPDGMDGTEHWIWNEGSPRDIPVFEGYRVVLLGPQTYPRSWNACRLFPKLDADIAIEQLFAKSEVQDWLQRLPRKG